MRVSVRKAGRAEEGAGARNARTLVVRGTAVLAAAAVLLADGSAEAALDSTEGAFASSARGPKAEGSTEGDEGKTHLGALVEALLLVSVASSASAASSLEAARPTEALASPSSTRAAEAPSPSGPAVVASPSRPAEARSSSSRPAEALAAVARPAASGPAKAASSSSAGSSGSAAVVLSAVHGVLLRRVRVRWGRERSCWVVLVVGEKQRRGRLPSALIALKR